MNSIDLSYPAAQLNLACDEALLNLSEEGQNGELLRFWETPDYFVVVGYSNKISTEVATTNCKRLAIPIYRRISGGGTILQGPGCLNYSLILKIPASGPLTNITETNRHILGRHRNALRPLLGDEVQMQGMSDLALGSLKFSGNAQRRRRRYLLFHGTFLLQFDISKIEEVLPLPSRQPPYRETRPHSQFLTNISVSASALKETLRQTWGADQTLADPPRDLIEKLAQKKYSQDVWNRKF